MRKFIICAILVVGGITANAAVPDGEKPDSIPFYDMTLEQLMNVNVTVASDLPMTNRESPGIVSVITQDEIRKAGATDLMQVLQLVPGFDFGFDVEGVVGVAVRGNWAHEGKVLLLWDGVELNEDLYSTLQFGGHYPVSLIKRIEIIRGPGSAMYGGNAEYAVINIISELPELNGVSVSASSATFENAFSGGSGSISFGKKITDGRIGVSGSVSDFIRSSERYVDNFGNGYDMSTQSGTYNSQFKIELVKKGLSAIAMCDNYTTKDRDGYEQIYLRAYDNKFFDSKSIIKYEFSLPRLKITPGLRLNYSKPWNLSSTLADDDYVPFNTTLTKGIAFVNFNYEPSSKLSVIAGSQWSKLTATDNLDSSYFSNGSKTFRMWNFSSYAQAIYRMKYVNLILGGRYTSNEYYGNKFVPRAGITIIRDKFHVKTLFSQAFRAPSVENINYNPDIKAESTNVIEIEMGVKVSKGSYFTANVFDITTKDPIIYFYNDNSEDDYKNESPTGTRGFELEYKLKSGKWYLVSSYSFYTTSGHPVIENYGVPGVDDILLAFPKHKFTLRGSAPLSNKVSLCPSLRYVSKRYAVSDATEIPVIQEYKPSVYLDINISTERLLHKYLVLNFGCRNITDAGAFIIQSYRGNHAPVPYGGREFYLSLNYTLPFTK